MDVIDALKSFDPVDGMPIEVDLLSHLSRRGFKSRKSWDYWDFYVLDDDSAPLVAVKTAKNGIGGSLRRKLTTTDVPYKVILLAGTSPWIEGIVSNRMLLNASGTSVWIRDSGWIVMPGTSDSELMREFRFKNAPEWTRYDEGWRKRCHVCGRLRGPDEFYKSGRKSGTDPYRHKCKDCTRAAQRERDRANSTQDQDLTGG